LSRHRFGSSRRAPDVASRPRGCHVVSNCRRHRSRHRHCAGRRAIRSRSTRPSAAFFFPRIDNSPSSTAVSSVVAIWFVTQPSSRFQRGSSCCAMPRDGCAGSRRVVSLD